MGACSCACDYPEYFDTFRRKARKIHTCCECGSQIDPKEEYELSVGKWQGTWAKFKTCSICAGKRIDLYANPDFDCDCLAFGYLWEFIDYIEVPRR